MKQLKYICIMSVVIVCYIIFICKIGLFNFLIDRGTGWDITFTLLSSFILIVNIAKELAIKLKIQKK
jgi:hypothetical protein